MATLDFSNATVRIDMTDPNLVGFGGAVENAAPTVWSFLTPTGHDLQLEGQGMTFNAQGRALSGTVQSIGIDLGDDDFDRPDVAITGIDAAAATLDDGPDAFWRFLEGDDTIIGPPNDPDTIENVIFGDGLGARAGANTGGNDVFELGDSYVQVAGDVWTVGSQTAGTPTAGYRGGSDTILAGATAEYQDLIGDAYYVYATGDLTGGNDTILTQNTRFGASAIGDAAIVEGIAGDLATVVGGNDVIAGGSLSAAFLTGDVFVQRAYSFVRGGDDIIKGSDAGDNIFGDVYRVGENQMIGGADRLWGGGGNDYIYGDFEGIEGAGKATAGNDTIHGGAGDDRIYGDGTDDAKTTGGDDRLFGEAGDDRIGGGTGNDLLDGGAGQDGLHGGPGNDTYVIDIALDSVNEYANNGIDTVRSHYGDITLWENVENLTFIGTGNFTATGNGLANTIRGGTGADSLNGLGGNDRLHGGGGADMLFDDAGNDVLDGGAGGDQLVGGDGFDTASYAGSEQAVNVSLDGSVTATGDAVGDTFNAIEALEGTSFNDVLAGDGGDNTLTGGAGADTLIGGDGVDTASYAGALSAVTVSLAAGAGTRGDAAGDTLVAIENLTGSDFSDTLTGNGGFNTLTGGFGNDTLSGGGGGDVLVGGVGADTLVGGLGSDTASFLGGNGVTVSLLAGTAQWGHAHGDMLSGIENLIGSAFFDELTGDAGANVLDGGEGNDFLNGSNGDDHLIGFDGDDMLLGGAGADTIEGGAHVDTVSYANSDAAVQVNLATGVNTGGHAGGDTLTGIDIVTGSAFADTLTGAAGDDTFNGGQGNDRMIASAGADTFNGNQGIDTADYSSSSLGVIVNLMSGVGSGGYAEGDRLTNVENLVGTGDPDDLRGSAVANALSGGGGADVLLGGAGDDVLDGGAGDDVLSGYTGFDIFVYNSADFGDDTIIGFQNGVDKFDLNGGLTFADFTETAAGSGTRLTLTADPDHSILILGVAPGLIDAGDFV